MLGALRRSLLRFRVQIAPQVVARNSRHALDGQNLFGGNRAAINPLGNCLGGYADLPREFRLTASSDTGHACRSMCFRALPHERHLKP